MSALLKLLLQFGGRSGLLQLRLLSFMHFYLLLRLGFYLLIHGRHRSLILADVDCIPILAIGLLNLYNGIIVIIAFWFPFLFSSLLLFSFRVHQIVLVLVLAVHLAHLLMHWLTIINVTIVSAGNNLLQCQHFTTSVFFFNLRLLPVEYEDFALGWHWLLLIF